MNAALTKLISEKLKDGGVDVVDVETMMNSSCLLEVFLEETLSIPTGLWMRLHERLSFMKRLDASLVPLHKPLMIQAGSGCLEHPSGIACTMFANQSKMGVAGIDDSDTINLAPNSKTVLISFEYSGRQRESVFKSWIEFLTKQEEFYIGESEQEEKQKEESRPWKKKNRLTSVAWNSDQKAQKKKELLAKMAQSKTIRMKK